MASAGHIAQPSREPSLEPLAVPPQSQESLPPSREPAKDRVELAIAFFSAAAIAVSFVLEFVFHLSRMASRLPLLCVLVAGGGFLVIELARKAFAGEFGSDLLAGISIITATVLGEYLVGAIIVLMLSGGATLEHFATRRASSALAALARRMPRIAHRKSPGGITDISAAEIAVGDRLVIFPNEICPVDGTVLEGHGRMDEAYLTGEPFEIAKAPGSQVLSGAVNGPVALTITASKLPVDSRYAQIVKVMEQTEAMRPPMRRLADMLGAWYTPLAVAVAIAGGLAAHSVDRFLAVLVIATPCPLLIAIPVSMIGAISLCARRGIVIKNAAALEEISTCSAMIFDKTGTLTYGHPSVTEVICAPDISEAESLQLAASLEQYSKHPLAGAILKAAKERGIPLLEVSHVCEEPGQGLQGTVSGRSIEVLGRAHLLRKKALWPELPAQASSGLECVILIDGAFAALLRFADEPRAESRRFVRHLFPRHRITRVMLLSGDRQTEVENLARLTGIPEIRANKTPEEKVQIVTEETRRHRTLFVGDGLNDAPAMKAATVGVAFGQSSHITAQAADAVIIEPVIRKIDELIHIGQRTRAIALQSAAGGMALSMLGMAFAAFGYLPALAGAIAQEIIDVAAVLNALRILLPPSQLHDL